MAGMGWDGRFLRVLGLVVATLAAAACSGSNGSGLTTGSTAPTVKTVANDPPTRALQAVTASARAQRCGFNIDAAKLEAGYLAYESTQGTTAGDLTKIAKGYQAGRKLMLQTMTENPDFCSEPMIEKTRADLARHLAGDFAAQ